MKNFQILSLFLSLFLFNCSKAGGGGILPLFGIGSSAEEGGVSTSISDSATLKKIVIEPPSASVVQDSHAEFTATAIYSDGTKLDVSSTVNWSTNEPSMAEVGAISKSNSKSSSKSKSIKENEAEVESQSSNKKGIFKGVIPGKTKVKATLDGISGESELIIKVSSIAKLEITQLDFVATGSTVKFQVIAILNDGTKQDITKSVEWNISDGSMGNIVNDGELAGALTAYEEGNLNIVANFSGLTVTSQTNISKTKIASLSIEGNSKLVKGLTSGLRVVAVYQDGSHRDVTTQANWLSEDTQVLEANNDSSKGIIKGLYPGEASIRASLQGIIASKKIIVTAPRVVALNIKESASAPAGYTYKYQAIGEFDDNTSRDVTLQTTWEVDDDSTAFIYNSSNSGNIQALKTGTVRVTASVNGIYANSVFTVKPALLTSISTGASLSLPNGLSSKLVATGTFSDNSKKDLSSEKDLVWSWKGEGITISNLSDSLGQLSTSNVGKHTVYASINGITSSGMEVSVTSAILQNISLEPSNLSLPKGKTEKITAFGFYSDKTKKNITKDVTWILDSDGDGKTDSLLGEISNSLLPGLVSATIETEGKGKISASLDSISAQTNLSITSAVLESISLTSVSVPRGITATVQAVGFYSDKTSKDITRDVEFTITGGGLSSDKLGNIATDSDKLSTGSYDITATLDGKTATSVVTVSSAILKEISLGPEITIAKGITTNLTATGIYSDKSKKDITKDVTWSGGLSISNSIEDIGKVFGEKEGKFKIVASLGSISTSSNLNVSPARLESLTIEPSSFSIPKGTSMGIKVFGKYTDGKRDITSDVSFALDSDNDGQADEILGSISNSASTSGLFSTNNLSQIGSGKLIASIENLDIKANIEVRAADLTNITLSPARVPTGITAKITAMGTYTDGTTKDITREVSFSNQDNIFINQENGEILTLGLQGEYQINANLGSIKAKTFLTVSEAQLVSLSVSAPPSIAKGLSTTLTAFGMYTDGNKRDLSSSVTWLSNKTDFISNTSGSNGFLFASRVDDISVQASFNGVSSTPTIIKIIPATLLSLSIDQSKVSIPKGTNQIFTVTGEYTDGKRDLTSNVTWDIESPTFGSISNDGSISGNFSTSINSQVGTTKITASYNGFRSSAELEIKPANLVSISMGSPQSIANGLNLSLKAIGTYTDGSTKDISSSINWSVSDSSIFIDSSGNISTSGSGKKTITASLGSISTSIELNVTSAELVSLTVTPALKSLAKGTTIQLSATGVYTDGTRRDHTKDVLWNSDASKTSVDNSSGKEGFLTAVNTGISTVSASLSGRIGSAVITVSPAELVSISLGAPKSIADGLSSQFRAIGTYTDNSTVDISSLVNWTVSGKGSVSNGIFNGGLVSTSGDGVTTVNASYFGVSGSTTLTVTQAEITSIALSQANFSLAKGISSTITVLGFLTNGKTTDLSSNVSWTADSNGDGIDDQNVVSVSNILATKGQITTNQVGTSVLTASISGKSSSITITVTKAELVSISVTPANPSIAKGLTQQFKAVGFYTDNTSQEITQAVSWIAGDSSGGGGVQFSPIPSALTGSSTSLSIDPSGIASISNTAGSQGLLSALNPGSVNIYATKDGKTGSVSTNIGQAVLTGVSITSNNISRPKGLTEQFKATGVYSDGSTQDLTSQINWKCDSNNDGVDDSIVASISNQTGLKGLVTANSIGSVVVTGSINNVTATRTFSISPAVILSVEFQNTIEIPTPTGSVAAGLTDTIKAIASYSDNTIQDVSSNVTWIADSNGDGKNDNLVAIVDANGLVKTVAPGTVKIIGTINGISSTKTITVQQPNLTMIEVTPSTGSIAEGYTQAFTATGTYSDGSKQDITNVTSWKSDSNGDTIDDGLVASISNTTGRGIATGIKAGSVTVTASYNNQTATSTLTITPGVTKTQTVGSYDLTLPSGLSTTTTTPSGSFSGIVYTGGSGLTGFVSTIPDYNATSADTLGTTVVGKILNDSPDRISNTSIISSNTVNINNGGTVVYDMTLNTNTPMKPTDVSNHLIHEIGTNTPNGSVSNLPLPQGSETTSTDFRAIVQVTYNQYGSEMIGVGVTTATTYTNNQAIISTFLNGSNLIVTGTTLVDKTDTFTGTELPKVDFVWVVDNSGSMAEEQSSVINNSLTFFNKLNGKNLDFRLGVLATGNAGTRRAWELWGTGWVNKSDTNASTTFQSNVRIVGLGGSGSESGIYYAERSIGGGPSPISPTVTPRVGAKLVFVILSDEGDHYQCYTGGSFRGDSYSKTVNGRVIFQPCDGGVAFDPNNNLFKTRGHRVYSIIGLNSSTGQAGTCATSPTSAATSNNRSTAYFDLARATGGSSSSICSTKYDDILENISTQSAAASSSYNLSRKPLSSSIIVKTNGVTINQDASNGWMYNSSSNSIVFSGSGWPAAGAKIEVSYKFDSSVAFNEFFENLFTYFKTSVSSVFSLFQA
jgi:hypothetical protein